MKNVTILQLDINNPATRHKMFASISLLHYLDMRIEAADYHVAWSGFLEVEDCEDVFKRLQGIKPEGYKGHSLSVSDIVILEGKAYYCDSYGFKHLRGFDWAEKQRIDGLYEQVELGQISLDDLHEELNS